jgi:hypothetical protein
MKTITIYLLDFNIFSHPLPSFLLNLTATLVLSSHRDVEALHIFSEFIPEFPQELKVTFSDSQSFLRKIEHPKERGFSLGALAAVCCTANFLYWKS